VHCLLPILFLLLLQDVLITVMLLQDAAGALHTASVINLIQMLMLRLQYRYTLYLD